jgi:Sulfate permease family
MTEAAGDGSARAPGEIGFGRAKSVFLEHLQHRRAVRQEPRRNRSMSGLMPEFRSRMSNSSERRTGLTWLWLFPPARWLPGYRSSWVRGDVVAGVTLAAYAIPVSLLCRTCGPAAPGRCIRYLLGGLGYALLGSCPQLAIGPTSAISLMIAGTVGATAEGDAQRYRLRASQPSPWPRFASSPGCCD